MLGCALPSQQQQLQKLPWHRKPALDLQSKGRLQFWRRRRRPILVGCRRSVRAVEAAVERVGNDGDARDVAAGSSSRTDAGGESDVDVDT